MEEAAGVASAWAAGLQPPVVPQQPLLSWQPDCQQQQRQQQRQQPGQQHQGLHGALQELATRFPDQASVQDVLRGISLRDLSLISSATSAALRQRLAQAEARLELLQQVLEDLRAEQRVQLQLQQQLEGPLHELHAPGEAAAGPAAAARSPRWGSNPHDAAAQR
jgi:hypothetical protein